MSKKEKADFVWLMEHPDYREVPFLTFSSFIDDCLHIGDDVYPNIRAEGDEIIRLFWERGITEAILNWGIGSGKSMLTSALTLYFVHVLLCYIDPHKTFHLAPDKPVATINMGSSATQAKNVVFTALTNFISQSEWFQKFEYEPLGVEIKFFKHGQKNERGHKQKPNICLYCGNSKETTPLGYNIFAAVCDEFAFYLNNDKKSVAMDIYDTMKNRIASRFGVHGFIMPASSSRYEGDAIDILYQRNKELHNESIYCTRMKSWELKDRAKMSQETFDFVVAREEDGTPKEVWHNIPIDYKKPFDTNPEKSMRDFGCKPSAALEPFDRDGQVIVRNTNKDREDPLTPEGKFKADFKCNHSEWCYAHIDLGHKKDACGICVAHNDGFDEFEGEEAPKVAIDLIMQMKAKPGGEILFSEVRAVLYAMIDRGFDIKFVSFDGWQSTDSIQILKSKGIDSGLQSIDRTTEAYDTLKALLHRNALDYYKYTVRNEKGEDVNILEKEYLSLELIKAKKVDHPENGSKDVADAVAGAINNVVSKYESKPGMS